MKRPKTIIDYDTSKLGQLHCDTPGCGYIMPEPAVWSADLIGAPCPKCGASLLTQSDYDKVQRLMRFIDLINRIFGPLFGRRDIGTRPGDREVSVRIHGDQADIKVGPKVPS